MIKLGLDSLEQEAINAKENNNIKAYFATILTIALFTTDDISKRNEYLDSKLKDYDLNTNFKVSKNIINSDDDKIKKALQAYNDCDINTYLSNILAYSLCLEEKEQEGFLKSMLLKYYKKVEKEKNLKK